MELILDGSKKWEIRGSRCHIRGLAALFDVDAGCLAGVVRIASSVELSAEQLDSGFELHRVPRWRESSIITKYQRKASVHAWILEDAQHIAPVPASFPHSIVWVDLHKHFAAPLEDGDEAPVASAGCITTAISAMSAIPVCAHIYHTQCPSLHIRTRSPKGSSLDPKGSRRRISRGLSVR